MAPSIARHPPSPSRTAPSPPRSTAQIPGAAGGLIGIEADGIVGWAHDASAPDRPMQVRIMAGGQLICVAIADRFDDPRIRTLAGPGIGGFVARLAVLPMAAYPLSLSLHGPSGDMLGNPLTVEAAAELAPLLGAEPPYSFEGHVDGLYAGALQGWVRNTAVPEAEVEVELLDTGRPIGTTLANLLREDLRTAGLDQGLHGFSFDLPATLLDGALHALSVRVLGTSRLLRGGPVSFGPTASSALMQQMTALQSEVAQLRTQVDRLIAPDGAVQRGMLRILAERVSAQADIQREQMERDMDALKAMVFTAAERSRGLEPAPGPEQYGQSYPADRR